MKIEVSKENISINKLITQKKEIVFVHNDIIVPDSKPDILNTINVMGNICIFKKEVLEGRVKVDGNIDTYIMYLPDSKDDNLRGLNCNLDFSENIQIPNLTDDMQVNIKAEIKDMECKVLNGRKISIKAGIEFNIKVYSNDNIEIINEIKNVDDIQILRQDFNTDLLIGNGKTSVYAKDTLNIDTNDELAEILKVDINLVNKDLKISYNKILAKSDIDVKIMYLTEDNRIGSVEGRIPAVGFIDIQNIADDNICDINYEIKNNIIRPNPAEEHSIYVELELEVLAVAYEKRQIKLIEDLYSPTRNLEYTQRKIVSLSDRQKNSKQITIKDNIKIAEIQENNILDVEVRPILTNTKITNTNIVYIGEINLNFIFEQENAINSRVAKIPFEIDSENTALTDKIDVETECFVENKNFNVMANGEIGCEIEMGVLSKISKNIEMNIIDNIEEIETEKNEEDYDSLILYLVNPGDSLWKIAKKFNSTVEEISKINGIEDIDKINVGQKLYIPKFNYIKKDRINAKQQPINV